MKYSFCVKKVNTASIKLDGKFTLQFFFFICRILDLKLLEIRLPVCTSPNVAFVLYFIGIADVQ